MITYGLRDALQFLMQHEHRHINQAIKVRENDNFPKKMMQIIAFHWNFQLVPIIIARNVKNKTSLAQVNTGLVFVF
jgi:hypothetical protein